MQLTLIILLLTCFVQAYAINPLEYEILGPGEQSYHGTHDGTEHTERFNNQWLVQVHGGKEIAQLVALEFGYQYEEPVLGFPDVYIFSKRGHSKHRRAPTTHTLTLVRDARVKWAEQLFEKSRVKRYHTPKPDAPIQRQRLDVANGTELHGWRGAAKGGEEEGTGQGIFNDELWAHEWYLQDTRTIPSLPRLDLNVLPAYAQGYNGEGVRITVLDDGIEHNHTDLRDNYDPEISWDCNDRDADPSPRYEAKMKNSHGTRCAGEIAMTANNYKCGVGVAWKAKVGGIRMLDGRITDRIEGEAISYAVDKVDIYSASWGPNDDGRTVEGPGRLALEAFKLGVTKGRGGKGTIYVWANGNGGGNRDNCNCDGYSSSIYTISIGSASQHGLFPWYGETCSSTLAAAYSSGAYKDQKIATTDTGDKCTLSHTGTSAAAPLAAGIIALVLQANPNLTWRDVQHLIVWTSEYAPLSHNPGWQTNGVGLRFDVRFGFGLMNAGALVSMARNWTTVPKKIVCRVEASPFSTDEGRISSNGPVEILLRVEKCQINFVEHVEFVVNIQYSRRGALQIHLQSPRGIKVQLLSPRPYDKSTAGFVNWPLMSVATWGENSNGIWKIVIEDRTGERNSGSIGPFKLIVHGTAKMPAHMKQGPRKYKSDENHYKAVFNYLDQFRDQLNQIASDVHAIEDKKAASKFKIGDHNDSDEKENLLRSYAEVRDNKIISLYNSRFKNRLDDDILRAAYEQDIKNDNILNPYL